MAVRRLARSSWDQTGLPCGGAIRHGNQFTLDPPVTAYVALCITVQCHARKLLGTPPRVEPWWFVGHLWTGASSDDIRGPERRKTPCSATNPLLKMASEQSRVSPRGHGTCSTGGQTRGGDVGRSA